MVKAEEQGQERAKWLKYFVTFHWLSVCSSLAKGSHMTKPGAVVGGTIKFHGKGHEHRNA